MDQHGRRVLSSTERSIDALKGTADPAYHFFAVRSRRESEARLPVAPTATGVGMRLSRDGRTAMIGGYIDRTGTESALWIVRPGRRGTTVIAHGSGLQQMAAMNAAGTRIGVSCGNEADGQHYPFLFDLRSRTWYRVPATRGITLVPARANRVSGDALLGGTLDGADPVGANPPEECLDRTPPPVAH
jgi:hypothetical protein